MCSTRRRVPPPLPLIQIRFEICIASSSSSSRSLPPGLVSGSLLIRRKRKGRVKHRGVGAARHEEEVADAYEWRWTEAVSPEILALVLRGRVAADNVARGAALVCRPWSQAVASPDMWVDVDIEAWCRRVNCRARADDAMRRLVARARGTLQRLSAYRVGNTALSYVATSGSQIPMCEITHQGVEKHAECLTVLKVLDISNCLNRCSSVVGRVLVKEMR